MSQSLINIPKNIKNINYALVEQVKQSVFELEEKSKKYNFKTIKIRNKVVDNITDENMFEHLIPPYKNICDNNDNNERCRKLAAFKNIRDMKYYCWYHKLSN